MAPIRQITISGFRGILLPLTLQFVKGRSLRSMAIYGANGSGKSSITDAWEWFHTEKIEHLAREGAGSRSYPHRNADKGQTFVEVQFADNDVGDVRLEYDHSRITIPQVEGDIETFRALAPHPCHIRHEDLTRFVYLPKAEKHDALARLMGFTPQVEFQKDLRRVLRKLGDELETYRNNVDRPASRLMELLALDSLNESQLRDKLNEIFEHHGIEATTTAEELGRQAKILTKQVEDDPRARDLALLRSLVTSVEKSEVSDGLIRSLQSYLEQARAFIREEKKAIDLLLLELYEQGQKVVSERQKETPRIERCPLCGQTYDGDLLAHIQSELAQLQKLKEAHEDLLSARKRALELLSRSDSLSDGLQKAQQKIAALAKGLPIEQLRLQAEKVQTILEKVSKALRIKPAKLDDAAIRNLRRQLEALEPEVEQFNGIKSGVLDVLDRRIEELEADSSRKKLVSDHQTVLAAIELWEEYSSAHHKWEGLKRTHAEFEAIIEDYVQSSIANVEKRFEAISSKVQTYFEILEEHTEGIGKPAFKLLTDQDRAVMLQVKFRGETIAPAYRYLSESQLNSFGLAIFLASAEYFNRDFKFLILDDVINSFDGYKRPQVIKLLKQEFPDHQVLLLTHDNVWRDRLYRECPRWVRNRFSRLEPGIGPIMDEGFSELEMIERHVLDDQPEMAGKMMGPFLERQLQELCESFEALVKFNRRNEYTLEPLLDRFRVRVKGKLKSSHPLHQAIEALQSEAGFRNLMAHWKNPAIQLSSTEMKIVVEKWKAIEELVRCDEDNCYGFLQYDGSGAFVCGCGATHLTRG